MTAAAGGETYAYVPGTLAACQQLAAFLRDRLIRYRSVIVWGSTLAAPIKVYAVMYDAVTGGVPTTTANETMVDEDRILLNFGDCPHKCNWNAYDGTSKTPIWLFFTALTISDVIAIQVEMEVVE